MKFLQLLQTLSCELYKMAAGKGPGIERFVIFKPRLLWFEEAGWVGKRNLKGASERKGNNLALDFHLDGAVHSNKCFFTQL